MITVNNIISFIIFSSFFGFYIPIFGNKSISICELIYPFAGLVMVLFLFKKKIQFSPLQLNFSIFQFSKLVASSYFVTSLRAINVILFVTAFSKININRNLLVNIYKKTTIVIWLIFFTCLINYLVGNGLWSSLLRTFNILPPNLTYLNIRSWYNEENGVISLFLTQNALSQYLFTSYILIKLITQTLNTNFIKFILLPVLISLILCKTTLAYFAITILLSLFFIENSNSFLKAIVRFFLKLKVYVRNPKIAFLFSFLVIFLLINNYGLINQEILSSLNFLKGLSNLQNVELINNSIFNSSNTNSRIQLFFEYFDKISDCKLLGDSGISKLIGRDSHNNYLYIVHKFGWIPLSLYLSTLLIFLFKFSKNKNTRITFLFLFLFLFFSGFQGTLFNDSRLITPFLLILLVDKFDKNKFIST